MHWDCFRVVVRDGVLLPRLMPRLQQRSDAEAREIFLYIRAGARVALDQAEPPAAMR